MNPKDIIDFFKNAELTDSRVIGIPHELVRRRTIPLEATVWSYRTLSGALELYLSTDNPEAAKYAQSYSPVKLDLREPLVQEIRDSLRGGTSGYFNGVLTVKQSFDFFVFPTTTSVGTLNGELNLGDKKYHTEYLFGIAPIKGYSFGQLDLRRA